MSRERWQELDEAAPAGPWSTRGHLAVFDAHGVHVAGGNAGDAGRSAAAFIAAARTAWPAAERECERLRGTCDDAGHRAWFAHLAEAGAAGPSEAGGGDDMPELLRRLAADRPELLYPLADDTLRAELGHAVEVLYVICEYASVDTRTLEGAELSTRPDIHRVASDLIDRIAESYLLDDEGQQR